jgi:biopolymer transport protein ExbD
MRAPQLLSSGSTSINMTPMIDVVFLLIIFFLVSSHLAKQENAVKLDLPTASSGLADNIERDTLVANVLPGGAVQIGGVELAMRGVEDAVRRRLTTAAGNLQLRIRTDRNVPYAQVEPLLGIAARAGVTDVVFSVIDENQRGGR